MVLNEIFQNVRRGYHKDRGTDPTYRLDANEAGHIEPEINIVPNRNLLGYDRTYTLDYWKGKTYTNRQAVKDS
jgi:hypothetical protein